MMRMLACAAALACGMAVSASADAGPRPEYPRIAKEMGIEGRVVMLVVLDESGRVTEVKRLRGNTLLCDAARDALRQWKFERDPKRPAEPESRVVSMRFSLH